MIKEKAIQTTIKNKLESLVRGSVSFVPKNLLVQKNISEKIWKQLEWIVSTCMKESYHNHITQKTSQDILTITRDLIYIDASKKWDFDIFTYITKVYFNQLPEEIRIQYNKRTLRWAYKEIFTDYDIETVWGKDILFDIQLDYIKQSEYRKEHGSDSIISFSPLSSIGVLMWENNTQDLNILLDKIDSISSEEMLYINNLTRSWLLISSESRVWLYINNGRGKRDYSAGEWNLSPNDWHDMTLVYL